MRPAITKIVAIMVLATTILSCNINPTSEQKVITVDTTLQVLGEGSCQYLTSDHNGEPVICWVQEDTSNIENNILMVSSWITAENKFAAPLSIPGTKGVQAHEEGMSKIAFRKNGEAVIMFSRSTPTEKSKFAATVYYMMSRRSLAEWSEPARLVTDTSSYSQRFFDMAVNNEGEISVIWLDSRKEKGENGSSLYYAETYPGKGFINEKKIIGTTCECCRTKLYPDKTGKLNIAFRDIINDTIRDMSYTFTADGGNTFSEPVRISNDNWVLNGCPHTGPDMTWSNNKMNFTWYTQGGAEGVYYCSTSTGDSFSDRLIISNTGRHPQIENIGNNVHVVYEEIVRTKEGIDRPIRIWTLTQDQKQSVRTISAENSKGSYPVMYNYKNSHMIIAWGEKTGDLQQVVYRLSKL